MLKSHLIQFKHQHGTSLLEVLITIIILAFGLLGLAGLQSKIQLAELESYQRAQAILLLSDMTERINANRAQAGNYVSTTTFGTGDTPGTCPTTPGKARDLCEWSYSLQGVSEQTTTTNMGAMVGARGCITQVQAPDPTSGICQPGIYRVAVAWQGMHPTTAPAITCGQGSYGTNDTYRRVISSQITVGQSAC